MNSEVLKKATKLAQTISGDREKFPVDEFTYTGMVLEEDHIISPELTKKANAILQIALPPTILIDQLIAWIDNHPIAGPMVRQLLQPAVKITSFLLNIPEASPSEIAQHKQKRRVELQAWNDMLWLNQHRQQGKPNIHVIDRQGKIL